MRGAMTGQKRFTTAAIVAAVLAVVTLAACGPSSSTDNSAGGVPAAGSPAAGSPAPGSPTDGTAAGSGQDASLGSLIPPNWNTSLCSWASGTDNYWTINPNAEYSCTIDLGDSGGANITGETITGDQWSSNPGYAGPQALNDWVNNQSQSLTIQQVSSITDCPTTDTTVACEFPWSNSTYPASSDQVGMLVFENNSGFPSADLLWAISSQNALFDIKGWHLDAQYGDLATQTWFLQNLEHE
jgi:hypothetical protein